MPRWRCSTKRCRLASPDPAKPYRDFIADLPVCPVCEADARKPQFASRVVRQMTVHLVVEDDEGPILTAEGGVRIACAPERREVGLWRCTGGTAAVNCERCKATELYRQIEIDEYRGEPRGTAVNDVAGLRRIGTPG